MSTYQYSRLDLDAQEIRLLVLHPGPFGSPLRLSIVHKQLSGPKEPRQSRLTPELNNSLPENWIAVETLEGQILYEYCVDGNNDTAYTSWTHPNWWNPCVRGLNDGNGDFDPLIAIEPSYEALSYTWGTLDIAELVYLAESPTLDHDLHFTKTLSIGANLASALRHLRYSDSTRTLWADGICINQADPLERGSHILRMGDIYSLAERVVVWLGTGTEKCDLALQTLQRLGCELEVGHDFVIYFSPECTSRDLVNPFVELPFDDDTWIAIQDLLNLSWFTRVWIIQEIQLGSPKTIMLCRNQEVSWGRFRRAIICIENKQFERKAPAALLQQLSVLGSLCCDRRNSPLSKLMRLSGGAHCANPSDKVYGVLGLAPPEVARRICPDYSIPAGEVYKDLFLQHLALSQRLELFLCCGLESSLRNNTPSWVPDWSVEIKGYPLSGLIQFTFATGHSAAHVTQLRPDQLGVIGVHCGTVSTVSEPLASTADILSIVRSVGKRIIDNGLYVTGEPLLEAYSRVLTLEMLGERAPTSWPEITVVNKVIRNLVELEEDGLDERAPDIHPIKLRWIEGRRLFHTEEGYIGFAPAAARIGDVVCTFLGCMTPMMIRPAVSIDPNAFQIVGECFMHGIMDADSILGPLGPQWQPRTIRNREAIGVTIYYNRNTKETTTEDPRLGEYPPGWVKVEKERTPDDPIQYAPHRNMITGEEINSDPRLAPELLTARGIKLHTFNLI